MVLCVWGGVCAVILYRMVCVVCGGGVYMGCSMCNNNYENCHYLLDRQRFIVYIIIRRCELVQHKGDQKWESNGQ